VTASHDDSDQQLHWQAELEKLMANPKEPIPIRAFVGMPMQTGSRPIRAIGVDGRTYIVKGKQAGRQIINDQVVGHLGVLLEAPVAEPYVVEVDEELINDPDEPEFSYFQSGLAHGSLFISGCMDDRSMLRYQGQAVNRDRFARLSVLYGWVGAADRQFLYKNQPPNVVYSVDHGHFFPGGPDWTIDSLLEAAPAVPDLEIVKNCRITEMEMQGVLMALVNISEREILEVVARPATEWGITIKERVALVAYLVKRRQELLSSALGSVIKEGQA
jgi:hypothetical protein